MTDPIFRLSDRIRLLPVIHGSGDSMLQTRRMLLADTFDTLAVPLPPSHGDAVLRGIEWLPEPSAVVQVEPAVPPDWPDQWTPAQAATLDEDQRSRLLEELHRRRPPSIAMLAYQAKRPRRCNVTPIDPCQPVIAAIRLAIGEHQAVEFVDCEVRHFRPQTSILPDPFALKTIPVERFSAAVLPFLTAPRTVQHRVRIWHMASRLIQLERAGRRVVMVCGLPDWPWLRLAYHRQATHPAGDRAPQAPSGEERLAAGLLPQDRVREAVLCPVASSSLLFLLGELPYTTALYERARQTADSDEDLTLDAVKSLYLDARAVLPLARRKRITSQRLTATLRYARNLTLLDRRLSPDFYTVVLAAQQTIGDRFAEEVARLAGNYAFRLPGPEEGLIDLLQGGPETTDETGVPGAETLAVYDAIRKHSQALHQHEKARGPLVVFGPNAIGLSPDEPAPMTNRLAGSPLVWRRLHLTRTPDRAAKRRYRYRWNPNITCSYPPEDEAVEAFRAHVVHRAKSSLGLDAATTQKFTTSLLDGIDIRETLRHWYEGSLYVRDLPPVRGTMDAAVMLFDVPADPQQYAWRTTWYAENEDESTLVFYATDYRAQPVGPGICRATYGGALFLFPPRMIPDAWEDRQFDFCDTLEERLIAAACRYAKSRHVALLSPTPPGRGWRMLAALHKKRLVHLPLSQFSGETIERLREVHVLNGHQVRSYASRFIEGQ